MKSFAKTLFPFWEAVSDPSRRYVAGQNSAVFLGFFKLTAEARERLVKLFFINGLRQFYPLSPRFLGRLLARFVRDRGSELFTLKQLLP